MIRPFFKKSISELEKMFDENQGNIDFLKTLLEELEKRSTKKAITLKQKVFWVLGEGTNSDFSEAIKESTTVRSQSDIEQPSNFPEYIPQNFPEIENEPEEILSAWAALEILSPPSFRKPEDLANGEKRDVIDIGRLMPWDGGGERSRKNYKLYYHIILGSIEMEQAISSLMQVYADKRAERPLVKGEAVVAALVVDKEGRPVHDSVGVVSSFAWGVPKAIEGNLRNLNGWDIAEKSLGHGLNEILYKTDSEGAVLPITRSMIDKAFKWLVETLKLPKHIIIEPRFLIRKYEYYKNSEPPEPLILNSFFLNDLATAKSYFKNGMATANLMRYLGVIKPEESHNLLTDSSALECSIAPSLFPKSAWPAKGHHPLILLQQAGVNLAFKDLQDNGILAINGPPGTGKTTLLRDIISEVITQRACVMVDYETPMDAFSHSGKKIKAGNGWLHLYEVDQDICGFEVLVTSSNNKAVENVSAELPGIDAVADDINLRYFKTLSDKLIGKDSWGLIAAVLGNSSNRYEFKQSFWWDKDCGLATYLAEASGTPQFIEEIIDIEKGKKKLIKRKPAIVEYEDAPQSFDQALARWKATRQNFKEIHEQSQKALAELESVRQLVLDVITLRHEEDNIINIIREYKNQIENQIKLKDDLQRSRKETILKGKNLKMKLQELKDSKPSFLHLFIDWLLQQKKYDEWRKEKKNKLQEFKNLVIIFNELSRKLESVTDQISQLKNHLEQQNQKLENIQSEIHGLLSQIDSYKDQLGTSLIDAEFPFRSHEEKHTVAPWFDEQVYQIRENVFIEAINTHKAFIDASAKPLRHNLGALMNVLDGKSLPENNDLIPDLWASLFLVVPCVSTTFASMERMLSKLPPEALGWLLIDEAGQALPQAAVGAIMRTKRAVVVGDPIQIEPVVTLPEELTESICRQFGIEPDDYNAPTASVQTLADSATSYFAEFIGRGSSRTVGVPLLVHRRCSEPMFGISNSIAYEHLMINKKVSKTSPIQECLGTSKWIDVSGSAREKWCPEEGEKVLELLQFLKKNEVKPDLYIVTPFVVVQDNLRRLIHKSGTLDGWVDKPFSWMNEHIGTVHTVQGREAEAVIFVLGAPDIQQSGARNWAGSKPNILNVAATRAKEVFYVIGNRELWKNSGTFKELSARLP
jgi:superfamily I DNA and/or RNA helicase